MLLHAVLCVGFFSAVSAVQHGVTAKEHEELLAAVGPALEKCFKEFNMTMEIIREANDLLDIDSCFYACFMRENKFMTEKGIIQAEKMVELVADKLKDKEIADDVIKSLKECTKVNEKNVADGEKGCDRAELFLECLRDLDSKFRGRE